MAKGKEKGAYASKKRKLCGNQWNNDSVRKKYRSEERSKQPAVSSESSPDSDTDRHTTSVEGAEFCTSYSKLGEKKEQVDETDFDPDETLTGFRFVDMELLISFVKSLCCFACRKCLAQAFVRETKSSLQSTVCFICRCGHQHNFSISKQCSKTYEVNRRFTVAMCVVGKHRSGATTFLGNMNIPSSLHRTSWTNHINQIKKATEKVADQSMRMAANEIRAAGNSSDITVSNDGTYHRRGFQSKNGVVTTLTVNGKDSKLLDTHVMSNHCDACSKQKKKNVPPEEQREWEVKHERDCEKITMAVLQKWSLTAPKSYSGGQLINTTSVTQNFLEMETANHSRLLAQLIPPFMTDTHKLRNLNVVGMSKRGWVVA
jgi:hypothetical protein